MRPLTWNLNARRGCLPEQLGAIAERAPDILALQEVTRTCCEVLRTRLPEFGLGHITDSFSAAPSWEAVGPRRYTLLLASRFPVVARPSAPEVPWPERIVSGDVSTNLGVVTVHTTHIPPGSSNGWMKVQMLEAVLKIVAAAPQPCILCGDFNAPQAETPDGRIVTWAERVQQGSEPRLKRRMMGDDAQRWDSAERNIIQGGVAREMVDAFRASHGYSRDEFSFILKRRLLRVHRRFDHIFCSPNVRIKRCEYLHAVREQGLSDTRQSSWTLSCRS